MRIRRNQNNKQRPVNIKSFANESQHIDLLDQHLQTEFSFRLAALYEYFKFARMDL